MLESNDRYLRGLLVEHRLEGGFKVLCLRASQGAKGEKNFQGTIISRSVNVSGDKSFADDLNKERGIVSCRVALLLRSSEIKPLF